MSDDSRAEREAELHRDAMAAEEKRITQRLAEEAQKALDRLTQRE